MSENLRAVIYARFSSDNQREESIDAQVRACSEYCLKKGYMVIGIYKDEAKSGRTTDNRIEYNKLLSDAEKDQFDVIVMHKIDRNSRNEYDYHVFKKKMQDLGIKYEYAAQHIDDSAEGQMLEGMMVLSGAYYSRNLVKETIKGMNENAHRCLFNGGTPPLGYDIEYQDIDKKTNQKINGIYVINEAEAEIVRLIFKRYLAGDSYDKIIKLLNEKGYKTKRNKEFTKSSLFDILGNERYIGTYTFNKTHKQPNGKRNTHSKVKEDVIIYEDAIPAIISKEDFNRVKAMRESNKKRSSKYHATSIYLLSGKIHCEKCGALMRGHHNFNNNKLYEYYTCPNQGHGCDQRQIRKEVAEEAVLKDIEIKIFTPQSKQAIIESFNDAYENAKKNSLSIIRAKKRAKSDLETKLNNTIKAVEEGGLIQPLLKRIDELTAQIAAADEDIKKISKPPTTLTPEEFKYLFLGLANRIKNKDENTKKILIDTFIDKVSMTKSNTNVTFTNFIQVS